MAQGVQRQLVKVWALEGDFRLQTMLEQKEKSGLELPVRHMDMQKLASTGGLYYQIRLLDAGSAIPPPEWRKVCGGRVRRQPSR
jgi:hypothetical protein